MFGFGLDPAAAEFLAGGAGGQAVGLVGSIPGIAGVLGGAQLIGLPGLLGGRGTGVTRLRCDLVHEDAIPTSIVLGLHCTRQVEHIMNVLR